MAASPRARARTRAHARSRHAPHTATAAAAAAAQITGAKHAGDKSMEQGGAGMSVLTKEALISGTFAGAGMKMDREALSGENQQQLEQIRMEVQDQDNILDEISKGLDDLKDAADKIGDVRARARAPAARRALRTLVARRPTSARPPRPPSSHLAGAASAGEDARRPRAQD